MNIFEKFYHFKEDVKAALRHERRILPHGSRGHIYESKDPDKAGPHGIQAKSKGRLKMVAKVTRANGDVEYYEADKTFIKED